VIAAVTAALADPEATVRHQEADLSDPGAPARLIGAAAATSRFLDILVGNPNMRI
jgi:3-oxoacyl-[acyl-carrier protein] reductase